MFPIIIWEAAMRDKNQFSRGKLSLRNLLNIEYESQYKSVTLNSRPKTMYNQRQLKIFQEERTKIMTENRLRRGVSSQQLSRPPKQLCSENSTDDRAEKQRLKHCLGKINLLAEGTEVQEEEKIRSIYSFLGSLSRTENFYKKAFGYVYQSFNSIVYVSLGDWNREHLQGLAQRSKCEILIKLYNGVKDISYKELSKDLMRQLEKELATAEEYQEFVQCRFREYETKLGQKNGVIKKMADSIAFYEEHPSKEQYGYISELEAKASRLEKDLRQANARIRELENSEEYLNQYSNMLSEKVEELRAKLYQFEIEQFSNLNEVEKNSDLKQFEQNVVLLKDLIHKGALKMATMREQYNKIESYNQELIGERSVLAKRAAVGFAQLTPRPNYKQIFKDNDIQMEELMPPQGQPSTQELMSSLVRSFKNFYSKFVQSQPKIEVEQKGQGQQNKDPAKLILGELEKAKKQLRRVEGLSEDVHKGYQKQKEDKEKTRKK